MRSLILFVGALLLSLSVFSQDISSDVIILKNGSEIVAKILEVTQSEIRYKDWSNLDGPIYTINKSDVFLLKYKNGKSDVMKCESIAAKNESIRITSFNLGKNDVPQMYNYYINSSDDYTGANLGISNQWGIRFNKFFIASGFELYNYNGSFVAENLNYGYPYESRYYMHSINLGVPFSISFTDFSKSNFFFMTTLSPSIMAYYSSYSKYSFSNTKNFTDDKFFPGNLSARTSFSLGYSLKLKTSLLQMGPYLDYIISKSNYVGYGLRISMVKF